MKKSNRGFTLIELLVVIAIIAVLSAVILASLSGVKAKGADATVKSNLENIRIRAELLFNNPSNGYSGVCGDNPTSAQMAASGAVTSVARLRAAAAAATGAPDAPCNNGATYWAVWAPLKSDPTKAWCVDSVRNSRQISNPGSAVNVCP